MKVNGIQEIGPRLPLKAATRGTSSSAAEHGARVESIASRVRQGTYVWPTSRQIADRILDDAALTAKLRAMLRA